MNVRFLLLSALFTVFSHVAMHAEMDHNNQAGPLDNNLEHHHYKQHPTKNNYHASKQDHTKKNNNAHGYGVSLMWGDELEEFEPEAQ